MKFLLSLILVAATYLTPLYPVYAADTATKPAELRRQELLKKAQEKKEDVKETLQVKRDVVTDKMSERRAMIASKTAALKTRLGLFKDKQKAQRVEFVNENLTRINEARTTLMSAHLQRMGQLLDRLEAALNEAEKEGRDVMTAREPLSKARSAIDLANQTVEEQKLKDYSIVVSSETTAKEDAKAARDSLHDDLMEVHSKIVDARKAVVDAITSAKSTIKTGATDGSQ